MEKNKIKINFLFPSFYLSGGTRVAAFYAQELTKKGYDVVCYAPHTLSNPAFFHSIKYQIRRLRRYVLNTLNNEFLNDIQSKYENVIFKDVKKLSDSFIRDANITIATSWPTAFYLNKMSLDKGEKLYFIQGFETWGGEKAAKYCLETYKYNFHKIVVSKWINDQLILNGMKGGYIIHNGLDTTEFCNNEKNYSSGIKCLMLDNSSETKGVKYGIEAFYKAKKVHSQLSLTMFGMEKSSFVPKDIEYYKAVNGEKLVELYRNADIFIFPSLAEGWGLTPIEAMACKCAVVATKTGCMMEIGKDEVNVLLSDAKDVDAMAENICRLVEDNRFRRSISEEGWKTVQSFDWKYSIDLFEKYILRCLKEKG